MRREEEEEEKGPIHSIARRGPLRRRGGIEAIALSRLLSSPLLSSPPPPMGRIPSIPSAHPLPPRNPSSAYCADLRHRISERVGCSLRSGLFHSVLNWECECAGQGCWDFTSGRDYRDCPSYVSAVVFLYKAVDLVEGYELLQIIVDSDLYWCDMCPHVFNLCSTCFLMLGLFIQSGILLMFF